MQNETNQTKISSYLRGLLSELLSAKLNDIKHRKLD